MFRFQHAEYLYALAALPVLILLFIAVALWRKKRMEKLGDARLVGSQFLGVVKGRTITSFILLLIALSTAIIGWANLQKGTGTDTIQRKGVDVMIALDVSKSMLAKDLQPDRLTRARQLILSLLDKMKNDRVGLIVFAGHAYLQVPLTIDYGAMKIMLQQARPDMVPTQGTVLGEAIDLATESFSQKEKKYKSLIIISDGEDHDERASKAASEAAGTGIEIHTVGVGSAEGAPIADPQTGSVKLDENGSPVVSKLNEEELRSIASAGKGIYVQLRNADDAAEKLATEIEGMEQRSMGSVVFSSYASYFQYFLIVAFVALLIEGALPTGKKIVMKADSTKMQSIKTK